MSLEVLVSCLLSGTAAAAVVVSIKEIVLWLLNRKAKKQDDEEAREREEEREDKQTADDIIEIMNMLKAQQETTQSLISTVDKMQKVLNIYIEDYKLILKDKIKYLVCKYLELGEITLEEKQAIQHMWHVYHYDFGGNGDLDGYMSLLENIPLKTR